MPQAEDYKTQRDRYIAFSLAAADLLIEVNGRGQILRTIGATNALLSETAQSLKGKSVTELFPKGERSLVARLIDRAKGIGRIDPATVRLAPEARKAVQVNLGACYLPGPDCLYITLTVLSDTISGVLPARDDVTGLINAGDFQHMAERAIKPTDPNSGAAMLKEMQLIRLNGLSGAMERMPASRSQILMGEIGALLRANSTASGSAAQLGEEEFGIITAGEAREVTQRRINADLDQALSNAGVAQGTVSSSIVTLSLDTANLDSGSVAKALAYVVDNFSKGETPVVGSLQENLNAAMEAAVDQYAKVKRALTAGQFCLHYQPVVDMNSRDIHHYEALMRFDGGMDVYDTVRFSEATGLVTEFDLAVCQKALSALKQHPGESIAVNMSGLSVQSDIFRTRLMQTLKAESGLKGRLLFELTESHLVENLDAAANFLIDLRRNGYRVCLDDFGSGAAAYNYLRRFDVDFIKIDGPFLKQALNHPRQRALIRSISVLCGELKCAAIAEMIENEDMVRLSKDLGITFGQGYLFGKPSPTIKERANPIASTIARRKGSSESWG